jgi:hypothetical protein
MSKNASARSIVKEAQHTVSGLVEETHAEIANLASSSITGLEGIRVADNHLHPMLRFTNKGVITALHGWRREVPLPIGSPEPVIHGWEELTLDNIYTRYDERIIRHLIFGNFIRLPRLKTPKSVTVDFKYTPAYENAQNPEKPRDLAFAISDTGYSEFNGTSRDTFPDNYSLERSETSTDDVITHYARAYSNALAVAGVVAHGVGQAHGINQGLSPAEALFNDWRKRIPGEAEVRMDAVPFWTRSDLPSFWWQADEAVSVQE